MSITVIAPLSCTSVTTAVSTSPSSASSGVIRTAPRANTSTTSLPVTYCAMSKSWIVMSRNSPPECRAYSSGGGAGIAAGDAHEVDVADAARGDRVVDGLVRRVEAPVEADLEQDARPLDRLERPVDLGELERDRLLAEDRLARGRRRDDLVDVGVGARADRDRVDLVRRVQLLGGLRDRDAEPLADRLRDLGRRVVDGREGRPLDLLREELGVHAADPPRPEHRDPDRGHRTTVSQPPDSHERISAACTAT